MDAVLDHDEKRTESVHLCGQVYETMLALLGLQREPQRHPRQTMAEPRKNAGIQRVA